MEKATKWVEGWSNQEENSFTGFTNFISNRMTGSINVSVVEHLKRCLAAGKPARIELPFGVFEAKVKAVGEGTNVSVSYEPSKLFIDMLNTDEDYSQISIDKDYSKLVQEWLAYGYFDADDRPDLPAREKGTRIDLEEVDYFIHSMGRLMATMAKDHQRDGKEFTLPFTEEFDFGEYTFTYEGDEIRPSFTASKAFKQELKNDSVLEVGAAKEMAVGMAAKVRINNSFIKLVSRKKRRNDVERDSEGFVVVRRIA